MPKYTKIVFDGLNYGELLTNSGKMREYQNFLKEKRKIWKEKLIENINKHKQEIKPDEENRKEIEEQRRKRKLQMENDKVVVLLNYKKQKEKKFQEKILEDFIDKENEKKEKITVVENKKFPKTPYGYSGTLSRL